MVHTISFLRGLGGHFSLFEEGMRGVMEERVGWVRDQRREDCVVGCLPSENLEGRRSYLDGAKGGILSVVYRVAGLCQDPSAQNSSFEGPQVCRD